jgi:hypothetical protein
MYIYLFKYIYLHTGTKGVLTEEFAILIDAMWTTANKARNKTPNQTHSNIYKKPLRPVSTLPAILNPTTPGPINVAPCLAPHDFKRVLQTCKSQFQGKRVLQTCHQ